MKEQFVIDDDETAQEFEKYLKISNPQYKVTQLGNGLNYVDTQYDINIEQQFKHIIPSQYADPIIFGKNQLEEIVAIEVKDNQVLIFKKDGEVLKKPMVYWMLSHKKLDMKCDKLEGNLHYKYIKRFKDVKRFRSNYFKYKHKDIFQIWNEKEAAMIYYGYTMFKGLKVKDVSVLSFDIEAAGLVRDKTSKVFLITNTFRGSDGDITKKHFRVDHYANDREMIEDWCKWVVDIDPVILTGHNVCSYDIPYIQHCYGTKPLPLGKYSKPIEIMKKSTEFRVSGHQTWEYKKIHIFGRHIIDTMFLAVKYDISRNFPSWGLKPIINYICEETLKKIQESKSVTEIEQRILDQQEGRQFYDASKIDKNWKDLDEREKIVQYGIGDSDDGIGLYDIMVPSIFYMTQSVPKPFQLNSLSGTGAQLNSILVRAYLQDGHSLPKASERESISGGISFATPGIHKNVFKIDVASEYPSIIRKFRVYPVEKDPKMYYTKMVDYFTEERFRNKKLYKETKDTYYDDLQASQKIFINSSYGLTSVSGLNFNDFNCGAFITGMGRQVIKESLKWATSKDITHWWEDYKTEKDVLYDNELFMKDNYIEFANRKKLYDDS